MPFSLGLYDLFTNIVPGFLYLFVISEFLQILGWNTIDLTKIDTLGGVLLVTVLSFILGHIFGSLTYNYWYKLFFRKHSPGIALARVRELYPNTQIDFKPDDNDLIFAVIRHHDKLLAEKLETPRVNSIMLRSISLGLFFYGILQIWLMISLQQLPSLAIAILALLFSAIALSRSRTFYKWFYISIFLEALNYGYNLDEVLATSKKLTNSDVAEKTKSRAKKQIVRTDVK